MKHPLKVEGFDGSLDDLAKAIGKMRFDSIDDFLRCLAEDLHKQADDDNEAGRIQLANSLYSAALNVYSARDKIAKAWKISKPYMQDTEQETQ